MRRTIILAAALSIIVLGLWGTIVIYFDQARLRSIFSERLSDELGRRVEIAGAVDFSFFPRPSLTLQDVLVASIDGPGNTTLSAQRIGMTLRVLPLLRGELAPGRMDLQGAVIDLTESASNRSGGASLLAAAALLEGRSLQLRDVTVRLPGSGDVDEIVIDAIDVDRFRLDETVSLRFRGDIGRPALLSGARMSADLYVPSDENGPVRLRDVELDGRLVRIGQPLALAGDLSIRRGPEPRVTLSGGRFELGESVFDVSLDYRGGESAALDLLASGEGLPPPLPVILGGYLASAASGRSLSGWSEGTDIRAQFQLDRLRLPILALSDLRLDLRSARQGLDVELAAGFPGGLVEMSGVLTGDQPEALEFELSLAEASAVFREAGVAPVLGGTGEARARVAWPSVEGEALSVEGTLALWDGFWRVAIGEGEPAPQTFTSLSAEFRYTPGYLAIPRFSISGSDLVGEGWAAAELPGGALAGEFLPAGSESPSLAVEGRLGETRLADAADAADVQEGAGEAGDP
jgi:hypothetical protein